MGHARAHRKQGRGPAGKGEVAQVSSGGDEGFLHGEPGHFQPRVLEEIGRETGLDMEAFTGRMSDPQFETLVYEETRHAQEQYGISSIPALVIQNRFLVEGAVPLSRYQQVLNEVRSAGSAGAFLITVELEKSYDQ